MTTRIKAVTKPRKRKEYQLTLKPPSKRKRPVLIYRKAVMEGHIRGEHRSGQFCLHDFSGMKCKVYGLPDGSLRIVGL